MAALTTLFPVFFMLALGSLAKHRGWISHQQKEGANAIIFTVLFPIMIFNLIASAQFQLATLNIVAYSLAIYLLAILVGKLAAPFTGEKQAHFSKYLMPTNEGGSVALPLYLSIVGISSNTVIFDLAGSTIGFLVIPVLVARATSQGKSAKELAKNILTNPFVLAVFLGLLVNLTGAYQLLLHSNFADLYQGTISNATGPIVGMILFVLGYDLSLDLDTMKPVLRLMLVRVAYYALAIASFFLVFPTIMADKIFMMAVVIYFMCPTGFALPAMIQDVLVDDDDRAYASIFISLYMLVTLLVYTGLVIFVA